MQKRGNGTQPGLNGRDHHQQHLDGEEADPEFAEDGTKPEEEVSSALAGALEQCEHENQQQNGVDG